MLTKLIALFQRHLIEPITRGDDSHDFVVTVRAVAVAGSFLLALTPVVNAVVAALLSHSEPTAGLAILLCAYGVFSATWLSLYLVARFVTHKPTEVLCDLMVLGFIAGAALWDVSSPTFLPYGVAPVFLAALIGWCSTPRAVPIFGIVLVGLVCQAYNHVTFRHDLHDRMVFFEASTATLSQQLNTTMPTFESRFPFHLYLTKDYFFPHVATDFSCTLAVAFGPFVLFFGMQYMTAQLRKQKAEAQGAVDTILAIADALSKYDTTTAKATLDAAQGRVPEPGPQGKYAPSGRSAAQVEGEAAVVPTVKLSADLVEPLVALVANLDAYRPYLPNWLLEASSDGNDDASVVHQDHSRDDTGSDRTVGKSAAVEKAMGGASPTASSASGRGSLSTVSSMQPTATSSHLTKRTAKQPDLKKCGSPELDAHAISRQCSFAVVTFEAEGEGALPASSAALGAFVDVLHSAAAETKGAVHSFALGEALLSWNCATACANPESKAAAFVARLRAVAGAALADLCCSAAVVTGLARCETAGSGQRAVTSMAPVAAVRLRGLSAFARAAAAEGGAGFAGLCDEATATGSRTNVVTSPAGVVDLSHVAPVSLTSTGAAPPSLLTSTMLLPPPSSSPEAPEEPLPAESGATRSDSIAAAFEIVSLRGDHGDEWLYAMVDGPSDVAAKVLTEMAAALAQCVGPPPPPSRQPPTYVRAAVEAASGLSTMRQAMGTAAAAMDRAAGLGADGAALSQRPLWVAWRQLLL